MKYEKAMAEVIAFDNSDVITASNCPGNSPNKGNGQGAGNDCATAFDNKQGCEKINSGGYKSNAEMWDAKWLS